MATMINSTTTLVNGSFVYLIDATSADIDITLPPIDYDYQFYTLVRTDNSANTVTVFLTTNTLISTETQFVLAGYKNIGLMSLNSVWYPVSGATNSIR